MLLWRSGCTYDDEIGPELMPHRFATPWGAQSFGAVMGWRWTKDLKETIASAALQLVQPLTLFDFEHQAGGYSTNGIRLVGVPITIHEQQQHFVQSLCERFYGAYGGWFVRECPEMILEVDRVITDGGLTPYDHAHGSIPMMEGLYPLAASSRNIHRLVANAGTLAVNFASLLRLPDLRARLALIIVAENSD